MTGESSDLLDQILAHGPSQTTVYHVLFALKGEGQTRKVIQGCLKALDTHPDDIRLRMLLAESYQETGFIGLAEAELERVTSDIDDLASAYKLRARIYARQKRLKEALESLNRYLALNPDDMEGLDLLDKIRSADAEAAAERELRPQAVEPSPEMDQAAEALEAEPGPLPPEEERPQSIIELATPTLAELYYNQGQILEAIAIYEQVLLNRPDDRASEQRLAQLRTSIRQEAEPIPSKEDLSRARTEKTIKILENWLASIRTLATV